MKILLDRWFGLALPEVFTRSASGEVEIFLHRADSSYHARRALYSAENFGTHYAYTLRAWRERFLGRLDGVRALGFDDRFVRMWDFYLGICEAAFLERHTGVFQLLLVRNGAGRRLFNEPWTTVRTPSAA